MCCAYRVAQSIRRCAAVLFIEALLIYSIESAAVTSPTFVDISSCVRMTHNDATRNDANARPDGGGYIPTGLEGTPLPKSEEEIVISGETSYLPYP
mgnify:CR=1 FL=1